jgi:hypothetical protein
VKEQTEYEQHRQQLHLGYGVAVVTGAAYLTIVGAAAILAIKGQFDHIGPLLTALGPYLLPTTGAIAGFAYARRRETT